MDLQRSVTKVPRELKKRKSLPQMVEITSDIYTLREKEKQKLLHQILFKKLTQTR